jgi:predicted permease
MVALPPRQLFEDAILAASSATLKLVFLVMIGVAATYKGALPLPCGARALAAHQRACAGVFNERGISDMGRLIYNLSLPALVFSNILTEVSARNLETSLLLPLEWTCESVAPQVTLEKLFTLWKLPCVAVLHVTTAFLLAKLLSSICRLKGVEEKAVKLCLMFGNCGALSVSTFECGGVRMYGQRTRRYTVS